MRALTGSLVLWALACGGPQADPVTPIASTASASAAPTVSAAPIASAAPDAGKPVEAKSPACAALEQDRAAENVAIKEVSESKDPLKRGAVLDDTERSSFTSCNKTKSGGAWGLALKDLKPEANGTTAQLVAIHIDSKGQKTTLVLKGPNDRVKERAFAVNDHDHTSIESMRLFDYDGDGEEELVVIAHDQLHEGPRDPMGLLLTWKNAAVVSYPPLKDIGFFRVEDTDKDGRLDLVTYGPYRSKIGARCNGAVSVAQGPALLVHSLPDGTFSLNDGTCIQFAKQLCDKPGFAVSRDEEKRVDDESTFMSLACARLWGMPDAQAAALVGNACSPISGEATCSEASQKQCVYPAVLRQWSKATPPLVLH